MFRSPLIDGLVVLVILLLIVGPKKLPQLGRGLGDGMREFKDGITGDHNKDEPSKPLSQATAPPATPEAPPATTPESGSERRAS